MSVGLAAPGGTEHTVIRAPPANATRLVLPGTLRGELSARRETDSRTAITRGLAELLEQLVIEIDSGRELRFQKVFDTWAEPEETIEFPSAIAYTVGPGVYEAKKLSAIPSKTCQLPAPDNRFALSPSDFVVDVTVELWATDPPERALLVAAMEDAFNPFVGQYGFSLDLPHYHNVRATFEPMSLAYLDSEADAIQRNRKAAFVLNGRVPLIKLVKFPDAKPRPDVVAVGPNVIVDGSAPC